MSKIPLINPPWLFKEEEPPLDSLKGELKGPLDHKKPAKTVWKINLPFPTNKTTSTANPVLNSMIHPLANLNLS